MIPFDKDGTCEGPQTRADLLAHAQDYSDIFVFSHGWNNDWTVATKRYEHFINGFIDLRRRHNLPVPPNYKPLLVGIFWPSQALAWFEKEAGPEIAGDGSGRPGRCHRRHRRDAARHRDGAAAGIAGALLRTGAGIGAERR